MGLVVRELQCDLVVSTLAAGLVRTSTVCSGCPIEVDGHKFRVNLISLPLQGLEVILGIDWLIANCILLDYGEKKLIFPSEDEDMSLSIGVLRQDIMEDLRVVNDFLDVFLEEVLGLPPSTVIEFSIDLVSGAGSVSIALYRMAPAELAELKK
ncbi:uncharacterized protein LOC106779875 [Vigna radiata var. radiata]|uniref:Uncharacterized protein LOC106779875 n=1 Tax=Vigna radiata var. radiata TaxID=3916 RepID=A0A1S3VZ04_VIGRR|nr:uncharacterized protein LOC106779875 [Vigna radiata var. radiata]